MTKINIRGQIRSSNCIRVWAALEMKKKIVFISSVRERCPPDWHRSSSVMCLPLLPLRQWWHPWYTVLHYKTLESQANMYLFLFPSDVSPDWWQVYQTLPPLWHHSCCYQSYNQHEQLAEWTGQMARALLPENWDDVQCPSSSSHEPSLCFLQKNKVNKWFNVYF